MGGKDFEDGRGREGVGEAGEWEVRMKGSGGLDELGRMRKDEEIRRGKEEATGGEEDMREDEVEGREKKR